MSKDMKLKLFRKILYGGKEYLFEEIKTSLDTDFILMEDITNENQKKKFIRKNKIVKFEIKEEFSHIEIAQKYFVPTHIN